MILILSDRFDHSTNQVIDWLKRSFIRINEENFVSEISFDMNSYKSKNGKIYFNFIALNLMDIQSFWYRRGNFIIRIEEVIYGNKPILMQLQKEWEVMASFLYFCLKEKRIIGDFKKAHEHNKLIDLLVASEVGLNIPQTIISNRKNDMHNFIENNKSVITKAINEMFEIETKFHFQSIGTKLIDDSFLNRLSKTSFPTLLQRNIIKLFELRIVFIANKFYAMAIFSQKNEISKIDYRDGHKLKTNRNIPFLLPSDISKRLKQLMKKLDLDTGSIDMIVTPEGEYVFLEVNPIGQFGWVSHDCNYYLEEKIANYLQNGN